MSVKFRSAGQIAISLSMEEKLRDDIDRRAKSLGLNRSQYLCQLARTDIRRGGELVLRDMNPNAPASSKPPSDTAKLVEQAEKKDRRGRKS